MAFECIRCGDCCRHLGFVHSVREDYGNHRFLVHNNYTCEDTLASVDPDKITLFLDRSLFETLPHACPFFRFERTGGYACCTIHATRPGICRDYGCWQFLIRDHRGNRAGKITHNHTLVSDDAILTRLFESCIVEYPGNDGNRWEEEMKRTLSAAGYSVTR